MMSPTKRHSWYPGSRRPRNRLRKRKNNPYHLGTYSLMKYYSSTKNSIYDRNTILDSCYTVGETWGALDRSWVGYVIAKKLENNSDMKLYASIIQKLEKELNIEVNDFPELGLCACDLEEDEMEKHEDNEDDLWTNEEIQEDKDD